MNHEGYHSLSVLLTKAFLTNNDAARGLVDPKWFDDGGSEGLIALSGAAQGELGSLLLGKKWALTHEAAERFKAQFPGRFYVELQRAGRPTDELATARLANFAVEEQLPVVATHPIQFLKPEDFEAHEVRCSIAEGYTLQDPRRVKRYTAGTVFEKRSRDVRALRRYPGRHRKYSGNCQTMQFGRRAFLSLNCRFSRRPTACRLTTTSIMLSKEGLQKRLEFLYPDPKVLEEKRPPYDKRLEYELGIVKGMKFPGYS